ncbi:MAG: transcriptional repressor [Saprospiraceae bacterium]|nr:transcriptional repressor [Saprospiraceae bacterium]
MLAAEQILKKHKLRVTQFRLDVIDIFMRSGHALSSADLEQDLQDADRITLYRTLKSFEDKGIIHKAIDGTQTQKFAICEAHCDEHHHHDEHVHFHCMKCQNTFCLDHVFVPKVSLPIGFTMKQTDMIVSGICEKCD